MSEPTIPCRRCICRVMCMNKSYDVLIQDCSIVGNFLYENDKIFADTRRTFYECGAVKQHSSYKFWKRLKEVCDELHPIHWKPETDGYFVQEMLTKNVKRHIE